MPPLPLCHVSSRRALLADRCRWRAAVLFPSHQVVCAVAKSNPEKGKFALKDKDAAMAAAFDFLRKNDAFPEDNDDDDDECAFGDDAFEEMGF